MARSNDHDSSFSEETYSNYLRGMSENPPFFLPGHEFVPPVVRATLRFLGFFSSFEKQFPFFLPLFAGSGRAPPDKY